MQNRFKFEIMMPSKAKVRIVRRPFRATAAQRKVKSLSDEQLAFMLAKHQQWVLSNVV